jgi:hypothetical protein
MIVNTAGPGRHAIAARHGVGLLSTTGYEAAVLAEGGNASGVIAESSNEDAFGVLANHLEGGTAVLGTSDAGIGLMGVATGGGTGVYARADDGDSVALTAEGTARFLGDVVVMGTLYAPTVVNAVPTSAEARQVAQRSARTAARIRAARSSGG